MTCPRCRAEQPPDARFCGGCGAPLGRTCRACSAAADPESRFCRQCGALLADLAKDLRAAAPQSYTPTHLAERILTTRGAIEGERKQVTVLFCDLAGSTEVAAAVGPEAMHGLLNRFFELALDEIHRYEGTVNQFLGDGFMALFGAPLAHEDHARRAALAALGIQRRLGSGELGSAGRPAAVVQARIGLHTGPVVVGAIGDNLRMDYTAVGDTTNLAARLQHLAEPNTVVASEHVWRLLEGAVEGVALGERSIKGLPAQRVWRVDGVRDHPAAAAPARALPPMVGRRAEMEALERAWQESRGGVLRLVSVAGEAGIGKSRLLREFRERLAQEQALVLQGHCSPYGRSTPFQAFVEIVREAVRVGDGDDAVAIEQKLRRGLEMLGVGPAPLPFLSNLLGLDPGPGAFQGLDAEIVGARTREALWELLEARCALSPLVLLVEDLHWTDTATEELLARASERAGRLPLLVVGTSRPEYRAAWVGRPEARQILLGPLAEDGCLQLVGRLLRVESVPGPLARLIIDKTEGNPLFAEEIVRYLVDSGRLVVSPGGVTLQASAAGAVLPDRLRDLIMARVDRIADGPRSALQVAAVVGRRFTVELLRRAMDVNGQCAGWLEELEEQAVIARSEADERAEYQFRHALIQDAVYESLLSERRTALHERVAQAIEAIYPDRLGEWADALAHHWSQTRRSERAVRYLKLAGERSLRVYSLDEADGRFREAVDRLAAAAGAADEALLADLLLSWSRVYYYRKDFKGLIALVEPHVPRVEASGDRRRLALLLFWLGFSRFNAVTFTAGTADLERALRLGEELGDAECIGYAAMGLLWAWSYNPGARPRDIVDRLGARALEAADGLGDVYLASKVLAGLAIFKLRYGRIAEAGALVSRLLALGRQAGDPRTVGMGFWVRAWVQGLGEERFQEAVDAAEEALRISPDPLDRVSARAAKGAALALMGRAGEALEVLRPARREMEEGSFLAPLTGVDVPLGIAMVQAGEVAAGVQWIEDAVRRLSGWGDEPTPMLGHLVLGEIYLRVALAGERPPLRVVLGNLGFLLRTLPVVRRKALQHLAEGVRLARELDAPAWIARGLLGLAELSRARGREGEARAQLEEALRHAEPQALTLARKIRAALGAPAARAPR